MREVLGVAKVRRGASWWCIMEESWGSGARVVAAGGVVR